jgi:hypothetical protein
MWSVGCSEPASTYSIYYHFFLQNRSRLERSATCFAFLSNAPLGILTRYETFRSLSLSQGFRFRSLSLSAMVTFFLLFVLCVLLTLCKLYVILLQRIRDRYPLSFLCHFYNK